MGMTFHPGKWIRLSLSSGLLALSCAACSHQPSPERKISVQSTEVITVAVKSASLSVETQGYARPNRPGSRASISVRGTSRKEGVKGIDLLFFPPDNRLTPPFFDAQRKVWVVIQDIASLPGWTAALTGIPVNEGTNLVLAMSADGRYEASCLRVLTRKP